LKTALSLIDVKILDHLIAAEKVFSFSAAGIL
jgi:DNA repair protein RadC